jgi:hypothetical protein
MFNVAEAITALMKALEKCKRMHDYRPPHMCGDGPCGCDGCTMKVIIEDALKSLDRDE